MIITAPVEDMGIGKAIEAAGWSDSHSLCSQKASSFWQIKEMGERNWEVRAVERWSEHTPMSPSRNIVALLKVRTCVGLCCSRL